MQRFCITPITTRDGKKYWVANFPGNKEVRIGRPAKRMAKRMRAAKRRQKKFASQERAELFLAEAKREWERTGRIELATDSRVHCDLLRAMRLLAGVGGGASLELAVLVYMQCRSAREIAGRSMRYEVARDRKVELNPRFFLMVQNEARERGISLAQAVEGLLGEVAIARAERAIRQREYDERRELEQLERRNEAESKRLREIGKERELRQKFTGLDMIYEAGRREVLERRNKYQRGWHERKRAERARKEQQANCEEWVSI